MLTQRLLLTGSLLLPLTSWAQAQADDHLTPPTSVFTQHSAAYYTTVGRKLGAGNASHQVAQVLVLPSFQPEYSLSVALTGLGDFTLIYRLAQASIWSATQPTLPADARQLTQPGVPLPLLPPQLGAADSVRVITRQVKLTPVLGQALTDLFNVAVAQTSYPYARTMRGDGTTFTFITFQSGARSGQTWSPGPTTRMGQLVEIVADLREVAAPSSAHLHSQALLLRDVQDLVIRLAGH